MRPHWYLMKLIVDVHADIILNFEDVSTHVSIVSHVGKVLPLVRGKRYQRENHVTCRRRSLG